MQDPKPAALQSENSGVSGYALWLFREGQIYYKNIAPRRELNRSKFPLGLPGCTVCAGKTTCRVSFDIYTNTERYVSKIILSGRC